MLGDLMAVVKSLTDVLTWKRQLDDERRKKFADQCDQISDVLTSVYEESKNRRQLINLCAELRRYVEPIREIAQGTLASDEIDQLATELDRVCDAWKQLNDSAELGSHLYDGYLDQIAKGAGDFRGLANQLRAK